MNVTNVVDDEAEGEGQLVILVAEPLLDLIEVWRGAGHLFAFKEGNEISQSIDDVDIAHVEVGVVLDRAAVGEVGLVDEVPVALCGVALSLDVVREGCALGERVVAILVLSQTWL